MLKECGLNFFIEILIASSINHQSYANASSSDITRLPLHVPITCHEFVFWIGDRKSKKEIQGIYSI